MFISPDKTHIHIQTKQNKKNPVFNKQICTTPIKKLIHGLGLGMK